MSIQPLTRENTKDAVHETLVGIEKLLAAYLTLLGLSLGLNATHGKNRVDLTEIAKLFDLNETEIIEMAGHAVQNILTKTNINVAQTNIDCLTGTLKNNA